jgi:CheY-like chemotaxis protein
MPVRAVGLRVAPPPDTSQVESVSVAEPVALAEKLLLGLDVLVVDDELDARELVAAVLGKCGAQVRCAASVQEGMEQIHARRPDAILSDIGLPVEDGYALIRRLREIDADLPVAALTAYAGAEDQRRALAAGFDAFVTKPVEPAELALLIASLAGRVDPRTPDPQAPLGSDASAG